MNLPPCLAAATVALSILLAGVGPALGQAPAPAAGDTAQPLSLDDLLARARERSTEVTVARWRVRAARAQLRRARSAFVLPRLRLESFSGLVPDAKGDIFKFQSDTTGVRPLGPFLRAQLEFAQPLYTFGHLARLRDAAAAAVDVERADLESTRQDLSRQVKELYYGILLAQDLSDLAGRLRDELDKWEAQLDPDDPDVPLSAPYKLQLARIKLRDRQREVANKLALARAALAWRVGLPDDGDYRLAQTWLEPEAVTVPSLDTLYQLAAAHRADWRQLRAGIAARSAQEEAARRAYYPQVFLAGGLRYAVAPGRTDQHNPFVQDDYNLFSGALFLGLRQSFEFGMLGADVDRARAQRLQLEARRETALQGIRLEVDRAYHAFRRDQSALAGALKARNLVREWVQIARDEVDLDPAQIKELVTAFEALGTSEEAYYQAIYDHNVALAELERVVGVRFPRDEGGDR